MDHNNTYCIIMAGGSGNRFWPVCSDESPKQFMDLLGIGRSMLQLTFERCCEVCPRENIIIVTSAVYNTRVHEQIPDLEPYQVLCEPLRRNTAPCIAYAAAIIAKRCKDATIVVTPADHAIFSLPQFTACINEAISMAMVHDWIITLGSVPTNPNTKYGYIQFSEECSCPESSRLHPVVTYTEKPPVEMARQFIASGEFFWNMGVFVWRLNTLCNAYHRHLPAIAEVFSNLSIDTPAEHLARVYSLCESVSVDVGIMEKADNVHVMKTDFGWSDVETWDSLATATPNDANGNTIASGNVLTYDSHNCVVHIPADQTLVLQGMNNFVVASNGKETMICQRDYEDHIMRFVSDVELQKIKLK